MPATPAEKNTRPAPTLELLATLYTLDQLKNAVHDMPQIALAGRSNVGKSSLINALARRKKLAKVSSEPGKTRSVNLFEVRPDGFCLTALPGYGYARRGHEERRSWAALIQNYLENTPTLRALALLIDCRIPTQESDRVMADFAKAHKLFDLANIAAICKASGTAGIAKGNGHVILTADLKDLIVILIEGVFLAYLNLLKLCASVKG